MLLVSEGENKDLSGVLQCLPFSSFLLISPFNQGFMLILRRYVCKWLLTMLKVLIKAENLTGIKSLTRRVEVTISFCSTQIWKKEKLKAMKKEERKVCPE